MTHESDESAARRVFATYDAEGESHPESVGFTPTRSPSQKPKLTLSAALKYVATTDYKLVSFLFFFFFFCVCDSAELFSEHFDAHMCLKFVLFV